MLLRKFPLERWGEHPREPLKQPTFQFVGLRKQTAIFLLNLFRQGHYFLNGFPFFVIMYYYNWASYRNYIETGKTLYEETLESEQESSETAVEKIA